MKLSLPWAIELAMSQMKKPLSPEDQAWIDRAFELYCSSGNQDREDATEQFKHLKKDAPTDPFAP